MKPLIRACSWCNKYLDDKNMPTTPAPPLPRTEDQHITDGICNLCKPGFMRGDTPAIYREVRA